MLKYLEIRNFVLIDKLKINFNNGFNVLTGETGAGKSIIISALELITGEKGSIRMVGSNGDRLIVMGCFSLQSSSNIVKSKLKEWNIEINNNELNIKREITKDGKSKSFINNVGVRIAELKELGDLIVDIHGQHEHQSLFNPANHLNFYDSFLNIEDKLEIYKEHYNKLTKLIKQYNEISQNKNNIIKEKSFLEYAIDEIEKANLKANEDEEIKNDISVMSNAESIASSLSAVNKDIFGNESGAYLKLTRSVNILQSISQYDGRLSDLSSQIEELALNLEDIKNILSNNMLPFYNDWRPGEGEYGYNYYSISEYGIDYLSEKIASINKYFYEYTGGAHGLHGKIYKVYSLSNGERLKIEDILIDVNDLDLINKVKEKLLSNADEESYFNLDALSLQENNFYITSKGLTFTWGIYEIAPYATGDSEVLFSIDEIMPYLKDEYKNIFE